MKLLLWLQKKESKKFMHKYLNHPLQNSQPKCIQISGNLSKVIKKATICLGLGFLYLGIGLLTSSWFLDILSILVIIGGIGLVNDALRPAKNAQNRYVLEQNEYSNIINNFNAYKEKMTQEHFGKKLNAK